MKPAEGYILKYDSFGFVADDVYTSPKIGSSSSEKIKFSQFIFLVAKVVCIALEIDISSFIGMCAAIGIEKSVEVNFPSP